LDLIGSLGWSVPDYESTLIEQLLLRAPCELPDQRQALLSAPSAAISAAVPSPR
jgi:hypothetical protein